MASAMAMTAMKTKKTTMAKITRKTKTATTTKIMKMMIRTKTRMMTKIVDAGIMGMMGRIEAMDMIVMMEDESAENERD